jgi:hypothetical protein
MTFSHLNRRVHLYLGLALLPWLFMYGISSVPFAHNGWFEQRDRATGRPLFTLRLERPFDAPVPGDPGGLRQLGQTMLEAAGIHGMSFGAYRQSPTQINVYAYSFWTAIELKYFTDRQVLRADDRRFRWDHFLTGMHARGGFEQESALADSWGVVVDLVQLGILLWIGSGLLMWWELRGHRLWGALAMAGGLATFVLFTMRL